MAAAEDAAEELDVVSEFDIPPKLLLAFSQFGLAKKPNVILFSPQFSTPPPQEARSAKTCNTTKYFVIFFNFFYQF
jgi:hypothetical protein